MFVGLAITFLLYGCYGASGISDIYFIALSIVTTLYLVLNTFVEQYLLNVRKIYSDKIKTRELFSVMFLWCTIVGIIITTIIFMFGPHVVLFFSANLDAERQVKLIVVFNIFAMTLYLYIPWQILLMSLGALGKIGTSNFLSMLPNVGTLFFLLYIKFYHADITYAAYGYFSGTLVSFLISIVICYKEIGFVINFKSPLLMPTMINSIKMKMAHNLHNVFIGWAITFFLSSYPSGIASVFFYAKKVSDTTLNVLYMPSYKILTNLIVDNFKRDKSAKIFKILKKVNIIFPLLFIFSYVLAYFIFPYCIYFINKSDFNVSLFLDILFYLFLANILISTETAYGIINQIQVDYKIITIANAGFIALFLCSYYLLINDFGATTIAIAIAIGQVSNFVINRHQAIKTLRTL